MTMGYLVGPAASYFPHAGRRVLGIQSFDASARSAGLTLRVAALFLAGVSAGVRRLGLPIAVPVARFSARHVGAVSKPVHHRAAGLAGPVVESAVVFHDGRLEYATSGVDGVRRLARRRGPVGACSESLTAGLQRVTLIEGASVADAEVQDQPASEPGSGVDDAVRGRSFGIVVRHRAAVAVLRAPVVAGKDVGFKILVAHAGSVAL